ncbi:LIC20153 family lipoprotein [Leptospira jelokensis]|uniref:LIC20153 family lipoprotein n=1 Tax=Leptospira jelokensis TaxID=2484931 RepID=UPI001090EAE9|nr:hypothetical protein [Leptospira jelokensis]TGM06416.1 hypothetical protein EHQ79_00200 [Leptospira jelokensis]
MLKIFTKTLGLLLIASLFINCPKEKEDDNTALLAILALSGGASCEVTLSGTSIGSVPLTTAGSGRLVNVGTRTIGSSTVAVISAKGVTAGQEIVVTGGISAPTIFKQSNCPLNSSQNVATVTTDYTLTSTSVEQKYTINTANDYIIFVNTTTSTSTIQAGVF